MHRSDDAKTTWKVEDGVTAGKGNHVLDYDITAKADLNCSAPLFESSDTSWNDETSTRSVTPPRRSTSRTGESAAHPPTRKTRPSKNSIASRSADSASSD